MLFLLFTINFFWQQIKTKVKFRWNFYPNEFHVYLECESVNQDEKLDILKQGISINTHWLWTIHWHVKILTTRYFSFFYKLTFLYISITQKRLFIFLIYWEYMLFFNKKAMLSKEKVLNWLVKKFDPS